MVAAARTGAKRGCSCSRIQTQRWWCGRRQQVAVRGARACLRYAARLRIVERKYGDATVKLPLIMSLVGTVKVLLMSFVA